MAPVYDFRHVELDKIGRGKRIVKPPGGECSNIFGEEGARQPGSVPVTPRKAHNYMQSTIFSPDSPDGVHAQNGHSSPATTPSKMLDTQDRLFGGSPFDDDSPRKVVNRQRSSIFEAESVDSRPSSLKTTPVRKALMNPITGEPVSQNGGGSPNGHYNGHHNGGTPNGHTNGYSNGHGSPDLTPNGTKGRVPPGGKCSGIF